MKKCEICELEYKICDQHDCFEALKAALESEESKNLNIRKSLGMDYTVLKHKCKKCKTQMERFRAFDSSKKEKGDYKCKGCPFKAN